MTGNAKQKAASGAKRDAAGRFLPGNTPPQRTPEGEARSLANLVPDVAGELKLQHGAWGRAGLVYPCDKCPCVDCSHRQDGGRCQFEAEYMQARRRELRALHHITPGDWPALEVLIWQEVRLDRVARFLAQAGEFLPGAENYVEWQPVAGALPALLNSYQRMLAALGLTPAERKKLQEKGTGGAAAALAAAIRELDGKEETEALEGDFEATDGGSGD